MTRGLGWALALVATLASSAQSQARGSSADVAGRHAGVAGVIHDTLGRPIRLATIFVDGSAVSAASDDSGRFVVRGLSAGRNGFTVTKIGYAPVSFETSLLSDSMIVLSIPMRSVQVMDPVKVSAARINAYLDRTGFQERKRVGLGTFLTPEKVDSLAPGVATPAQLLRGVRGIDVRCPKSTCVVVAHDAPGCLWLFLDGVAVGTEQIDAVGLTPSVIAAIEVYERPSMVPTEFQGTMPMKQGRGLSTAAGCGAVAIWTKSRVP